MKKIFFSYSHKDEDIRDKLDTQLSLLKRRGVIEAWHDRAIDVGSELDKEIDEHVRNDDIILLLVSPDFIASDYCFDTEMKIAMERHNSGDAIVVPIIIRPCDWKEAPFGKLMAAPKDGRPVTLWENQDSAFLDIVDSIKKAIKKVSDKHAVSRGKA
ncbi:toll/interleukin-1 receptor domain-containing protein [Vreelandella maris]|uniref:Toll/interleukin-1 receptor domain-containing protein n=1 Tax=Vreelandella maris TaxID=2729617 RepID=A0A7Y6V7W5_9GAMM|nr:toll/interleukin-1 receptor domain-containing protein [Halomonas maris]NVF12736.1 toll/interleukin-1 receptor domain-containing protein [Halomonas maris]|tara:strand:- start:3549 stop:4019 length:471 start_codon:yes stop_codon:yes gene_type:complete